MLYHLSYLSENAVFKELPNQIPTGGFDPPTLGLKDRCSNQLSYAGMVTVPGVEPGPKEGKSPILTARPYSHIHIYILFFILFLFSFFSDLRLQSTLQQPPSSS